MIEAIVPVIAALIGGFLAAGTGWWLDRRRENEKISRLRELIVIGIIDDLRHAMLLYDKIDEEWDKTGTVWFATLNEFRESRQVYQNNRDSIVLFENAALRKDIFRYYLQSAQIIDTLEYQQRRKYDLDNQAYELTRNLRMQDPTLSQDEAIKKAVSCMPRENQEYGDLNQSIPSLIKNKLNPHKSSAQDLLNRLQR